MHDLRSQKSSMQILPRMPTGVDRPVLRFWMACPILPKMAQFHLSRRRATWIRAKTDRCKKARACGWDRPAGPPIAIAREGKHRSRLCIARNSQRRQHGTRLVLFRCTRRSARSHTQHRRRCSARAHALGHRRTTRPAPWGFGFASSVLLHYIREKAQSGKGGGRRSPNETPPIFRGELPAGATARRATTDTRKNTVAERDVGKRVLRAPGMRSTRIGR